MSGTNAQPGSTLPDSGRSAVSAERTARGANIPWSARRLAADIVRRARIATRYAAGHLGRRDGRVWVFGNHKGFRDNARYLAEYIAHEEPGLEAWWVARTTQEADEARRAGLRVALRGSRDASRAQRRAGAAFLCNGFEDLEPVHLGGAFVVDLRHGKGLKRILLDLDTPPAGSSIIERVAWRAERWFAARRLDRIDLIVAPGEMARAMYVSAFRNRPERIRVLGTPRFDVILGGPAWDRVAGDDLQTRLGLSGDDYVVLWLPTWREAGDAAWLPRLDGALVDDRLQGTRVVVLVKPHPFSDARVFEDRLPRHPRIRLLPESEIDANALLRVGDALVTDYSSVAFDFALLDRPILFLAPDVESYRGGQGLYEPFDRLTGGQHHTGWLSLLDALARIAGGDDDSERALARRIRDRGRLRDEPGSCARIVGAVRGALGSAPTSTGTPGG